MALRTGDVRENTYQCRMQLLKLGKDIQSRIFFSARDLNCTVRISRDGKIHYFDENGVEIQNLKFEVEHQLELNTVVVILNRNKANEVETGKCKVIINMVWNLYLVTHQDNSALYVVNWHIVKYAFSVKKPLPNFMIVPPTSNSFQHNPIFWKESNVNSKIRVLSYLLDGYEKLEQKLIKAKLARFVPDVKILIKFTRLEVMKELLSSIGGDKSVNSEIFEQLKTRKFEKHEWTDVEDQLLLRLRGKYKGQITKSMKKIRDEFRKVHPNRGTTDINRRFSVSSDSRISLSLSVTLCKISSEIPKRLSFSLGHYLIDDTWI